MGAECCTILPPIGLKELWTMENRIGGTPCIRTEKSPVLLEDRVPQPTVQAPGAINQELRGPSEDSRTSVDYKKGQPMITLLVESRTYLRPDAFATNQCPHVSATHPREGVSRVLCAPI